MKDEIRNLLSDALEETSSVFIGEAPPYSDDLNLLSQGGIFDSITLLTYIGTIENLISERMGKNIVVMSEKVFSQSNSPFSSMKAFGAFIEELLN
jgi:hypothetical protein